MKKLLIVSYLFAPENRIGAVRPTKLAKYLNDEFDIEVITTSLKTNFDKNLEKTVPQNIKINELCHSKIIQKVIGLINSKKIKGNVHSNCKDSTLKKIKKKSLSLLTSIGRYIKFLLGICEAWDFLQSFKKHIKLNRNRYQHFDVIYTTYGPLASIICGLYFKKKNPNIKWICDFRDPMVFDFRLQCENRFNLKLQEKALKCSDKIVTVSHGYLKRICKDRYLEKSCVIPNGYDSCDLMNDKNIKTKAFSFAYTGYLYGGKRDLSPLFNVLHDLIEENVIEQEVLKFNYAGKDFSCLLSQAASYSLQNILVDYGFLPHGESIKLQKESKFLVLSTWNSKDEIGVFPGKFLEYMMIKKPIVSIVNGSQPGSEVAEVMSEANLGVSYEAAKHNEDYHVLKEYIKKEYIRFKNGFEPDFHPEQQVINRYSYENISIRFKALLQNE